MWPWPNDLTAQASVSFQGLAHMSHVWRTKCSNIPPGEPLTCHLLSLPGGTLGTPSAEGERGHVTELGWQSVNWPAMCCFWQNLKSLSALPQASQTGNVPVLLPQPGSQREDSDKVEVSTGERGAKLLRFGDGYSDTTTSNLTDKAPFQLRKHLCNHLCTPGTGSIHMWAEYGPLIKRILISHA